MACLSIRSSFVDCVINRTNTFSISLYALTGNTWGFSHPPSVLHAARGHEAWIFTSYLHKSWDIKFYNSNGCPPMPRVHVLLISHFRSNKSIPSISWGIQSVRSQAPSDGATLLSWQLNSSSGTFWGSRLRDCCIRVAFTASVNSKCSEPDIGRAPCGVVACQGTMSDLQRIATFQRLSP